MQITPTQSSQNYSPSNLEEQTPGYYENMKKIASFAPAIISDLFCFPFAVGLVSVACMGYNFNSSQIKKGITPIILLHGSGFNESEFVIARYFLDNKNYGSIFSFNIEGLVTTDLTKGIDDYAAGIVREKIKEIAKLTECRRVITLGHSMGGMIAAFYAENFSEEDNIQADHVFTVASPLKGTPTLDFIWSYISENLKNSKRNQQMSASGGKSVSGFCAKLCDQALESEQKGIRNYYSIYSETDFAVPFKSGKLTENSDRIFAYNNVGHYGIIALPTTWYWVASKLDNIYSETLINRFIDL